MNPLIHLLTPKNKVFCPLGDSVVIFEGHGCTKFPRNVTCPECIEGMQTKLKYNIVINERQRKLLKYILERATSKLLPDEQEERTMMIGMLTDLDLEKDLDMIHDFTA